MPSLVVIGKQVKEKPRGAQCMVPKDPSLNKIKGDQGFYLWSSDGIQ